MPHSTEPADSLNTESCRSKQHSPGKTSVRAVGDEGMAPIDPVDDNPFRRPQAAAATSSAPLPLATPAATPVPATSAGAFGGSGLQVPQYGTSRLDEANATAQRTVGMGADILSSLETQRTQLVSANDSLSEQRQALSRAGTLVSQMTRRALTNKMVLRIIALTLAGLIIIIAIAKWAPRPHHDNDHN